MDHAHYQQARTDHADRTTERPSRRRPAEVHPATNSLRLGRRSAPLRIRSGASSSMPAADCTADHRHSPAIAGNTSSTGSAGRRSDPSFQDGRDWPDWPRLAGLALPGRTGESDMVAAAPPTVGLHEDIGSVVSALVSRARIVTGMDVASAAVRDAGGASRCRCIAGSVRMHTAASPSGRGRTWGSGAAVRKTRPASRLPALGADHTGLSGRRRRRGTARHRLRSRRGSGRGLRSAVRGGGNPATPATSRWCGWRGWPRRPPPRCITWPPRRRLELAKLRQRQAIAGRLHDSIAQTLFSVGRAGAPGPGRDGPGGPGEQPGRDRSGRRRGAVRAAGDPGRSVPGPGRPRPGSGPGRRGPDIHRGERSPGLVESSGQAAGPGAGGHGTGRRRPAGGAAERGQARRRRTGDGHRPLGRRRGGRWCCRCSGARMAERRRAGGSGIRTVAWSPGSGLGMLADRAAALGGLLELTVDPDRDGLVVQRLTLPAPGYKP